MSENQSTPEDAPRTEGEPGFSFTDKRKLRDGDSPAASAPAPEGAESGETADGATSDEAEHASAAADSSESAAGEAAEADPSAARIAELEAQLAELAEDRKRDQAEYVNSRRRIEASARRDAENAQASVLSSLLSVLDDITLARQHGDLEEGTPFASIAVKLEEVLRNQGLEQYGENGEEFDPTIHEALMHRAGEEATTTVIEAVMQPGYRWKERVLRPARVGTIGPE